MTQLGLCPCLDATGSRRLRISLDVTHSHHRADTQNVSQQHSWPPSITTNAAPTGGTDRRLKQQPEMPGDQWLQAQVREVRRCWLLAAASVALDTRRK